MKTRNVPLNFKKLKNFLIITSISLSTVGCLDTDGDFEGGSTNGSTSISADQITAGVLPVDVTLSNTSQLPTPNSYEWNRLHCKPNTSVDRSGMDLHQPRKWS